MFHPSFTQAGATNPGNPWSQHHGLAPSQPDPQFVTPPQSTYVIPSSAPTRQHAPVHGVSQNQMPPYDAPPPVPPGHPPAAPVPLSSRPLPNPPAPVLPSLSNLYSSASGHINIADLGPVPKPFSLLSSGWTDADKLALERYNWIPWSQKVKNQVGMASGAWPFADPL
ncbi:hypothetical protein R3P38DRAFT_2800157 [Favolaschia claudopus]|uniref:Uncharacterized protein n=1 Tax=Favolaschia claudopus TaxID=2862362 RepID=A0AAV9ZY28_9AGAR